MFWTKPIWDKLQKDVVGKETFVTPSIISEKLKVNVSLAREAIKVLREEEKLRPYNENHSKYSCYVKTEKFVVAPTEKKEVPVKSGKGKQ